MENIEALDDEDNALGKKNQKDFTLWKAWKEEDGDITSLTETSPFLYAFSVSITPISSSEILLSSKAFSFFLLILLSYFTTFFFLFSTSLFICTLP